MPPARVSVEQDFLALGAGGLSDAVRGGTVSGGGTLADPWVDVPGGSSLTGWGKAIEFLRRGALTGWGKAIDTEQQMSPTQSSDIQDTTLEPPVVNMMQTAQDSRIVAPTEEEYFWKATSYFKKPLPRAPYCDQVHFTKYDPDTNWKVQPQHEACTQRHHRSSKVTKHVFTKPNIWNVTDADLASMCHAFSNMSVPWCVIKGNRPRTKGHHTRNEPCTSKIHPRAHTPTMPEHVEQYVFVRKHIAPRRKAHNPFHNAPQLSATESEAVENMIRMKEKSLASVVAWGQTLSNICDATTHARRYPQNIFKSFTCGTEEMIGSRSNVNRGADKRFTRTHSMRGRSNRRPNLESQLSKEDELENTNFGKPSEFTTEERIYFRTYGADAYGPHTLRMTIFCAHAGRTMYVSRHARNQEMHALNGNTTTPTPTRRSARLASRDVSSSSFSRGIPPSATDISVSQPPSRSRRAHVATSAEAPVESKPVATVPTEACDIALRRAQRELNPNLCIARTWSGCQCQNRPQPHSELCKQHQTRTLTVFTHNPSTMTSCQSFAIELPPAKGPPSFNGIPDYSCGIKPTSAQVHILVSTT